jgi:hypothetical protein
MHPIVNLQASLPAGDSSSTPKATPISIFSGIAEMFKNLDLSEETKEKKEQQARSDKKVTKTDQLLPLDPHTLMGKPPEKVAPPALPISHVTSAQQNMLKLILAGWKTFPELHGGLQISDLAFLSLQEFIQLSFHTLLVNMLGDKKELDLLQIAQISDKWSGMHWQKVDPKELEESFDQMTKSLKLKKEEIEAPQKHFKTLLLLVKQKACYSQPINFSEKLPSAETHKKAFKYISNIFFSLSQKIVSPLLFLGLSGIYTFSQEITAHFKQLEQASSSSCYDKKKASIYRVWNHWLKGIIFDLGIRVKKLEKSGNYFKELEPTSEKMKMIGELGKELVSSLGYKSKALESEFNSFECWAAVFENLKPVTAQAKAIGMKHYGSLQIFQADFCKEVKEFLAPYSINFDTSFSIDHSAQVDLAIEVIKMMRMRIDSIAKKIPFNKAKFQKNLKSICAVFKGEKNSKEFCSFVEKLIRECDVFCESYWKKYLSMHDSMDRICPHGTIDTVGDDRRQIQLLKLASITCHFSIQFLNQIKDGGEFLHKINSEYSQLSVKSKIAILISAAFSRVQEEHIEASTNEKGYLVNLEADKTEMSKPAVKIFGQKKIDYGWGSILIENGDRRIIADRINPICQAAEMLYVSHFSILESCWKGMNVVPSPCVAEPDESWLDDIDSEETAKLNFAVIKRESEAKASFEPKPKLDTKAKTAKQSAPAIPAASALVPKFDVSMASYPPLVSLVTSLANVYGFSENCKIPSDMTDKISHVEIAQQQQLHALHCTHIISKMHQTNDTIDPRVLSSLFFHSGLLSIEQALTSEYTRQHPNEPLVHHLSQLSRSLDLAVESNWVKQLGPFDARYPFSCQNANQLDRASLAVRLNIGLAKNEPCPKEAVIFCEKWMQEAIAIQKSLFEKHLGANKEYALKQLSEIENRLKLVDSDKSKQLKEKTSVFSKEQMGQLETAEKALKETLESLRKKMSELHVSSQMGKRLQNVMYHLTMLTHLPALMKKFADPEYWIIHGQLLVLSTQYLTENLGAYLANKMGYHVFTHDLTIYGTCYGLSSVLDEQEKGLLESLCIGKGLEYPFKYFSQKQDKEEISPLMSFLSELTLLSKTITINGKDFTFSGRKSQNIEFLRKQLLANVVQLSHFVNVLVQKHILV